MKKQAKQTLNNQKNLKLSKNIELNPTKELKFAVINYLNNQFKVHLGEKIVFPYIEKMDENEKIVFDQILMNNDAIGNPYIKSFVVIAQCLKQEIKDKKIIVFKYKSKKNYRVKTGHRQKGTLLQIIEFKNNYQAK